MGRQNPQTSGVKTDMERSSFFATLGRTCHEHRWRVLAIWVALFVGLGVSVGVFGSGFSNDLKLPDVESARGFDVLQRDFAGQGAGQSARIVFKADRGVTDPQVQAAMTQFFATVDNIPDVSVVSPYTPQGARQIAQTGPAAGTIAYAALELPLKTDNTTAQKIRAEIEKAEPKIDGLQIELGGEILAGFEPPNSEALGIGFAVVILILAFGSVIAMGLPITTALFGIGIGVCAVSLVSKVITMPEFTTTVAVMIGLGVGIDYALFLVTRYREELHNGLSEIEATARAMDTAGRAVLFAGTTVVISLLGMVIMGVSFVNGLAIGSAGVVFVTMIASLTLLPALLGVVGPRIEISRWRGVIAAGLFALGLIGTGLKIGPATFFFAAALLVIVAGFFVKPLAKVVPRPTPAPKERTLSYRWSRLIQRRSWEALVLGVVGLLVLAIPVLSLRLGNSDEGNFPPETTTRKAYDLTALGFGPGYNGPLLLVAELPAGTDPAALAPVQAALVGTPGVAFASPAAPNTPVSPTAASWQVIPTTSPQAAETAELLDRLRDQVLPKATEGTGVRVLVTGQVAIGADFSSYLAARLPYFLLAVLALSFLLLMVVFRSILVPLKAVIMNVLSLGAAYGCVVAVFQWGWLAPVFQVSQTGPIEAFVPMMLFAIVFGLSMDYEVFLLSRIREAYDGGSTNEVAVADGLAATARVITAAALIMVTVFGSFLLDANRVVKLFGLGLSLAVLLDATVVRMVLVPATMELLGDRNWWLPKWLGRILPNVSVDGQPARQAEIEPGLDEADREPVGAR
jgi:RND superfamily putative drug exporter